MSVEGIGRRTFITERKHSSIRTCPTVSVCPGEMSGRASPPAGRRFSLPFWSTSGTSFRARGFDSASIVEYRRGDEIIFLAPWSSGPSARDDTGGTGPGLRCDSRRRFGCRIALRVRGFDRLRVLPVSGFRWRARWGGLRVRLHHRSRRYLRGNRYAPLVAPLETFVGYGYEWYLARI
jgi:hypothetical protein